MDGSLPAGEVFAGRYELREVVGQGASAVVYRARDLRHDRDVAVKVLRDELTQSLTADRFAREIGITASLAHPHILPLYDSGESGGKFFYVAPFIHGESLRHRLEREPQLPLRDAVVIARAIASALECAHERGIVHRDIKPENVLLTSGQALLSDFGIARVLQAQENQRFTVTGLVIGTPQYMSPAQATGETPIDARSDIYSLGCMLYEMLAGAAPFSGPSVHAVILSRFAQALPDVRERRAEVPRALAELVSAMAARLPAQRVQTAAQLSALLSAVESECPPSGPTYDRIAGRILRTRLRLKRSRSIAAGTVAALLLLTTWLARDTPLVAGLLSRAPRVNTLAVLPLANLSGDVQQEFFADGLTEVLISDLSQLAGVKVISRTSVMQYKMIKRPMREIARELNADALLEGTVQREGERLLITANLVSGSSGENIWTRSYPGRVGELLDLQRSVGLDVAREIGARFARRSAPRQATVKPESQTSYLKGAYYAGQGRFAEATASFQKAVDVDPTNAAAYAALARAYYFRAFFGEVAPQEAFSQMRRAAGTALTLDPDNGEAHGLMALVNTHFDYDWVAAEKRFAQALALSPSNAQVHHDYAHFLLAMRRGPESVEESRRALELDPANPMLTSCLGWHSLFDERFDQSLQYATEAQRMMPSHWALTVQGWAESSSGQQEKAVESMRKAAALAPTLGFTKAALAHALARNGETREARAILAQLLEQARIGYVSAYDITIVYTGLGDADQAFDWLGKAIAERSMFVVHSTWDARLRPLHSDRRFAELTERLAAPDRPVSPRAAKAVAIAVRRQRDASVRHHARGEVIGSYVPGGVTHGFLARRI
ncbi:MAG: protein kinase domain-containing protein [Longimicrobiales bacterium]